ncbi:Nucleolar protein NOP2, putative [Coccidioides posadasii C735 delta SOWgp]|uniref:Nucleolar protein 2 n=1 Tax=Coccidioides posadasii (strain C735) TaxID=222929 RepID=C5P7Z9_COCP7|nr:S-adenosylmethionine-dependent methyltransferase superfamily domain-containing protein [Coccidioides posadasii C735 delta SOWgp]EER27549.1 Nucleolar protein NOP2, putative [Coccidioides posadasii C735 delta SOWgp]|eukprot:XP_003069694.1 S-adenosylmethionine-dependent methyltransferase superfamily domain-containing protein [Coccidioides posadasii C735 delta SOWgp]
MGVGRRMKKQGPPPPLDESNISSLKRRKADALEDAAPRGNKRRRAENKAELKKNANQKSNGDSIAAKGAAKIKKPKTVKTKEKPSPAKPSFLDSDGSGSSDDDMEELIGDEFEDLDNVSDDGSSVSGAADSLSNDGDSGDESDSVFDSDEDQPRKAMFSDDEDLSDAEEQLTAANIEGLSRKLDKQQMEDAALAEQEMKESAMQTNIQEDRPDVFGDEDQTNLPPSLAPNLQLLRTRITDTIRILGDLATLGQPGKSRVDYTDLLLRDICTYYGYTPYLAEKLFSLFTPMEAFAFFEANETPRPVVIRTNTLRTNRRSLAQALINRGVVLEPVGKWSKVGLQVFESPVPLGATPEYLAGHYILQAASSFLPVMALAPQPHERVLDMAAAPGGKTTYMSALMRNTGCVLANDANKERAKGLIGNIHRLGCKNTIVSNLDARTAFPKAMGGFDRVLLDAPCSGTGVISKDPSVKTSKTERDFFALPHMQKQLLLAAIDSTTHASKTGGYIVYSTCSVTVEENEAVVQYVLRKRPNVKIVDTGLGNFGSEGFKSYKGKQFDPRMAMTRRYFPHRENVDGFYVCKLKKIGPSPADTKGSAAPTKTAADGEVANEEWDKTPIAEENGAGSKDEGFGPFDDNEDEPYIARAERNRIRRKGLNPKAVLEGKQKKEEKAKNEDSKKKRKN